MTDRTRDLHRHTRGQKQASPRPEQTLDEPHTGLTREACEIWEHRGQFTI